MLKPINRQVKRADKISKGLKAKIGILEHMERENRVKPESFCIAELVWTGVPLRRLLFDGLRRNGSLNSSASRVLFNVLTTDRSEAVRLVIYVSRID